MRPVVGFTFGLAAGLVLVLVFVLAAPRCAAQDGPPPLGAPGATAIIAEVNGVPITRADLDESLAMDDDYLRYQSMGQGQNVAALKRKAEEVVLNRLIDEILIAEAARQARVALSTEEEREVDRIFEERVKADYGSAENLEEYLKARGLPIDRLRNRHRQGFLLRKLLQEESGRGMFVRPAEIRKHYEEHLESYRLAGRIEISQIVVNKRGRPVEEAKAQIADALEALKKGKPFPEVVKEFPDSPNLDVAGRRTLASTNDLFSKEEKAIAKDLKQGETSGVIDTPKYFTIIRMESNVADSFQPFEEVQDKIYLELENLSRLDRFEQLKKRLREKAYIKRL